ncbi:MAG: DNA adenine methylase [Oscillospiraceae bacterium]
MAGIARPFIPWIGSKEKLIPYIWQVFPSNPKLYLEPFGGGGALLLGIQPKISRMDIYNDFNCDLVNLFLCARECTVQLVQELKFLPLHSRAEFDLLKEFMKHKELLQQRIADERNAVMECFSGEEREELLQILRERSRLFDVQRAAAYYKVCRGSFSGTTSSFGVRPNNLTNFLYLFDDASKRLQDVIIENKDCLDIIRERDGPDSLIYCDPPYFDAESLYAVDFPKEKHEELHHILSQCAGYIVVSYNDCPFIRSLYGDFFILAFRRNNPLSQKPARPTANSLSQIMTRARTSSRSSACSRPRSRTAISCWCMNRPAARCGKSISEEGTNMKQTKTMLRLELEVKPEMAANVSWQQWLPMTAMAIGRRSILLASRQISAAAVLDTLTMLKGAQEAKLLAALEDACGSCDSLCEAQVPTDSAEKEVLQKIPDRAAARVFAGADCACASLHATW